MIRKVEEKANEHLLSSGLQVTVIYRFPDDSRCRHPRLDLFVFVLVVVKIVTPCSYQLVARAGRHRRRFCTNRVFRHSPIISRSSMPVSRDICIAAEDSSGS